MSPQTVAENHALVLGASGIIGWSTVNQLLSNYPEVGSFSKVTAVTNRPIKIEESLWPTRADAPELKLVSGVDLTRGDGRGIELANHFEREGVVDVTHIFYFVFTSISNPVDEVATNKRMMQNVLGALDTLKAPVKFIVFPGGTRGYGIYTPGGTFTPPLKEEMVDHLPPDYAKTVVYPVYRQMLTEASAGKSWTWCEICPDAIIGFTPNGSQFSLALHWAQYLSLYAQNHGPGAKVVFPGIGSAYRALMTPVSASKLARFAIYTALNPEKCGNGRLFNIGDCPEPVSFEYIWPRVAQWFGLIGISPVEKSPAEEERTDDLMPGEYIAKHRDVFRERGLEKAERAGVSAGHSQLDSVGTWLTFDRQLSLEKLRATGFGEDRDPIEGWREAFEAFRRGGLIL